ncbi:hypothetical protein [Thermodesulfatator atlanticus]|uniref:hypothetical protein n=1 Tax=Thermodesulfatator atlanticus TaxID=501497 RepID=UPI0003B71374|nr:hypothetical protein [Thermodesulfatator atlanticus]
MRSNAYAESIDTSAKPLFLLKKTLAGFFFLFLICACARDPVSFRARFTPLGLEVSGLPPRTTLALYNEAGRLILSYPPLAGPDALLVFPWKPGKTYVLEARGNRLSLKAPATKPFATVSVMAPLGAPERRFLLFPDKTLREKFLVSSKDPCAEIGLLVTAYHPGLSLKIADEEDRLGEGERRLFRKRLCFEGEKPITLLLETKKARVFFSFTRKYVSLKGKIEIVAWHLPTDESGLSLRYRREGLIVLPNLLFQDLAYRLGIKEKGYSRYLPYAYQTLVLKNKSPIPVNLLLKAEFLDPRTGKSALGFYPPAYGDGHVKEPVAFAYLAPYGTAKVVLPIYGEAKPGEYLFRIKVYPLGEKDPVLVEERLVGVTQGKPWLAASLLVIMACGLLFSLYVILGHRRLLKGFSMRELSLMALAGAVAFGLDFLGGTISNILYALLGPFNVLVGGLITEIIHYAVFTAIFVLVPKPGFATLTALIHYLMGVVLYGGMRATDPFFLGAKVLVLEAALFLFLCYKKPQGLRTVIALSVADAVQTFSSLVLHMTFYRLFFPDWYLVLSIGIKGFLYTLFGAALGLKIGGYLKELER